MARECYQAFLTIKENHTWIIDEEEKQKVEPLEMVELVDEEPIRMTRIGTNLNN